MLQFKNSNFFLSSCCGQEVCFTAFVGNLMIWGQWSPAMNVMSGIILIVSVWSLHQIFTSVQLVHLWYKEKYLFPHPLNERGKLFLMFWSIHLKLYPTASALFNVAHFKKNCLPSSLYQFSSAYCLLIAVFVVVWMALFYVFTISWKFKSLIYLFLEQIYVRINCFLPSKSSKLYENVFLFVR